MKLHTYILKYFQINSINIQFNIFHIILIHMQLIDVTE
jgi:hypothetical protein